VADLNHGNPIVTYTLQQVKQAAYRSQDEEDLKKGLDPALAQRARMGHPPEVENPERRMKSVRRLDTHFGVVWSNIGWDMGKDPRNGRVSAGSARTVGRFSGVGLDCATFIFR